MASSTVFIDTVLKLMWMSEDGRKEEVYKTLKEVFLPMAERTGTLWEKNEATASCNHGFASIVGPIISKLSQNK